MNKFALYTGADILFEQNFFIHQPTILEISSHFSEAEFIAALQICIKDVNDFKVQSDKLNSLLIFYALMGTPNLLSDDIKNNVYTFLKLLFKDCEVSFLEQGLIISKSQTKEFLVLDNNSFIKLQMIIKEMFCTSRLFEEEKKEETFNPIDERAQAIADMLNKGRKKIAEIKNAQFQNSSVFGSYLEILSIGLHLSMTELSKNTFFQMFKLLDRFTKKQSFDIDLKCRLAGAKGDKPLDNWMVTS
jgi:hypothetical protein